MFTMYGLINLYKFWIYEFNWFFKVSSSWVTLDLISVISFVILCSRPIGRDACCMFMPSSIFVLWFLISWILRSRCWYSYLMWSIQWLLLWPLIVLSFLICPLRLFLHIAHRIGALGHSFIRCYVNSSDVNVTFESLVSQHSNGHLKRTSPIWHWEFFMCSMWSLYFRIILYGCGSFECASFCFISSSFSYYFYYLLLVFGLPASSAACPFLPLPFASGAVWLWI